MRQQFHAARRGWLFGAGLISFAGIATAQGLMSTSGVVVATDGDPVPDANGTPIPGYTFGGTNTLATNCVLDEQGNILFKGRILDANGGLTNLTDTALFYGSSRATLKLVIQQGDQAPGLPAGIVLRPLPSFGTTPISDRVSPDGKSFWGGGLYDGGVTVTATNNAGLFGGPLGALTIYVRKGDIAPGTGGATYAQAFNASTPQFSGINRNGIIYFLATLVTGSGNPPVTTTTGMNNQAGIWAGLPGALELVVRRSDPVSGLGGEVAIDTSANIGTLMQMNDSGHLLYQVALSTTQGSPAATAANDTAYMVFTPGAGSQKLVREGDDAPGTFDPGTSTFATFNAISADAWSADASATCWTRTDEMIFSSELRGGDVIAGVNDVALFRGGVGTLALIQRRGDPAPGTNATFASWSSNGLLHNVFGQVCFEGLLEGGTSTPADDSGIWVGVPGSTQLVLREGDVVSGTGGSVAGSLDGAPIYFNDQGQTLFSVTLAGGTVTGDALFAWDALHGLMPVLLPGDPIEIAPGVFVPASGFGGVALNNTDGAAMCFGHDGTIGVRVALLGGANAQMIVRLPAVPMASSFCSGDGSGTSCPCGNNGATGNGCASSVNSQGANLAGIGIASITSDSFELDGTGLANSSGLYFQGTNRQAGGAGAVFGDGLRCAGGPVVRLGIKVATGGTSQYPEAGNPSISVRGGVTTPGLRTYQLWYRNAATFCTPSTFNLTNGVEVTWGN